MGKSHWQLYFGIALIAVSAALYFAHYLLFHDAHHIYLYLVGDIAFVPIEVLLVTLILHKLIDEKEKGKVKEKLNIVIGVFFSEIGTELLKVISALDKNRERIKEDMTVGKKWVKNDFNLVVKKIKTYDFKVATDEKNLAVLQVLLHSKREFMIKLLENPALLEHDKFTDLLRAVFHLEDELAKRIDIHELTGQDKAHIEMDIKRAYKPLTLEWINYLGYLKRQHPHFFLFAVATSPFTTNPAPEKLKG